jgi:hypothetical protein
VKNKLTEDKKRIEILNIIPLHGKCLKCDKSYDKRDEPIRIISSDRSWVHEDCDVNTKLNSERKKCKCSKCCWLDFYDEDEEEWSEGDLCDITVNYQGYYCELQGIPDHEYLMTKEETEEEIECKDFGERS